MTTPAVEVIGVSKAFRLPHQQITTFKEHFLHPFTRTSTLLKILAGIYRADSGGVRIDGLLSPFIELGVGFNMELSARDNVRVNGTLLGLSRRQLDQRFDDIIGFAELDRFVDQKLKNYSSGMLLRLAYSIAIQVEFDILLLDEVLAVGDESFQHKCFETFRRFREEGKTIVLVTHNLAIVEDFADRALLLQEGRMRAIGLPAEVISAYHESIGAVTA
jgi:ABC-type polysaccharide/polyol phosphate transport system ATPase subunit